MPFSKYVLLTGAGFTATFGGPLASAIHNMLCNDQGIKADAVLKTLTENNPDFEALYHTVQSGATYTAAQKRVMQSAVVAAFERIDGRIRKIVSPTPQGFHIQRVSDFIRCFAGANGSTGGFFTLNQDLFIERHHYNRPRPLMPAIRANQYWFSPNMENEGIAFYAANLPDAAEVDRWRANPLHSSPLVYIKLHGSCSWSSALAPQQMVIGANKINKIIQEPLLNWYFDLFKHALNQGDQKLLCFGYSFCDGHVNEVIANAIQNHGLKMSILVPARRNAFRDHILAQPHGSIIGNAIDFFFDHDFASICPQSGHRVFQWEEMCDQFFDGKFKDHMGS